MSLAGSHRGRTVPGLLLVAATAIGAALFLPGTFRALPPLSPDSLTYLAWNPGRPPAYPLFLAAVTRVSTDEAWIGWLQLAALLGSSAWLASAVASVSGRAVIGVGLAAAVALHPQVVSYAFAVLPESLFMSALMVHLGFVLRSLQSPSVHRLVGASLSAAVLVLLKPAGYAAAGCMVALAGWRFGRRPAAFLALVAPAVVLLLGVSVANQLAHGFFAPQAQGGYSFVAHVGPFVEAGDHDHPALSASIAAAVAPHRDALESIPGLELYYLFSSHDYHVIERIVRREIGAASARRHGIAPSAEGQYPADVRLLGDLTAMGGALARRAVRDHPLAYVRHVAAQFYGLWMLPLIQTEERAARLHDQLALVRAQSPELDRSPVAFRRVPGWVFALIRVVLGAAAVWSVVALAWVAMGQASPLLVAAAYAGVVVHATFLLIAAVQPGLPRYALSMWPATALVLAAAVAGIWRGSLRPSDAWASESSRCSSAGVSWGKAAGRDRVSPGGSSGG